VNDLTTSRMLHDMVLGALSGSDLETLFDLPIVPSSMSKVMPTDIDETDDGYRFLIDLPGVDKKDVSVVVNDGVITISAERNLERKNNRSYYERYAGTYSRSFRLPKHASEEVSATLKEGILEVFVRKIPEVQPKRITVN